MPTRVTRIMVRMVPRVHQDPVAGPTAAVAAAVLMVHQVARRAVHPAEFLAVKHAGFNEPRDAPRHTVPAVL